MLTNHLVKLPTANHFTYILWGFFDACLTHTTLMWRNRRLKTQPGIRTPFHCARTLTAKWGWFIPALQQHSKTEICLDDDGGKKRTVWKWEKRSENGERIRAVPKTAPKFFCKVWNDTLGALLVLCEWVSWVCLQVEHVCMYVSVCEVVLYVFKRAVSPAVSQ